MSDVIAGGAAITALFSLLSTYYSIYLNKQLEIKFLKFDKLVIETLYQLFSPLDHIFIDDHTGSVSNYLTVVTESLVDIELFIVQFQDYYTTLEIKKISDTKDNFSDYLYNNSSLLLKDAKIFYLAFKTRIFFELYDFARKNDIGHFHRLVAKVKFFLRK